MPITAQQARQELERRGISPTKPEGRLGRLIADTKGTDLEDEFNAEGFKFDLFDVLGEDGGAFIEMLKSPIQTGKGLTQVAGATSDIHLGTDFASDEMEKAVGAQGDQFVEEIKNIKNRPFRALSNLATFAPVIGGVKMAANAAKLGKVASVAGKAAKAVDMLDPLTSSVKLANKARKVLHPLDRLSGATKKAVGGVERTDVGFFKEYATTLAGLVNSKGGHAVREVWELMKDKDSRKEILRVMRSPDALADTESAFIRATDVILKKQDDAYKAAQRALVKAGEWSKVIIPKSEEGLAKLFNRGLADQEFPVGARVELFPGKVESVKGLILKADGSSVDKIVESAPEYRVVFDEATVSGLARKNLQQLWSSAQRIARQKKGGITMGDLDEMKKTLSREIKSMGDNAEGVSKEAKTADIGIKNAFDEVLKRNPAYKEMTGEFRRVSELMGRVEKYLEFDLKKGSTDRPNVFRPRQKHLGNRLGRVLDSSDSNTSRRREVMKEVEAESGDPNILNRQAGAEMSDFLGGGLVGRAAMSQGARRLVSAIGNLGGAGVGAAGVALSGSLLGGLASIPAFIILSPRATTATMGILLDMGIGSKKARSIAQRVGLDAEKWQATLKAKGLKVSDVLQKLEESGMTVGDLLKPAQQERRLEEDNPKPKNIFRTLGR